MMVATIVLLLLSFIVAVPAVILALQVAAACIAQIRGNLAYDSISDLSDKVKFVVLIPAHNEAKVLKETLNKLCLHLGGLGTVRVIADNCTDETEQIARECGAPVLSRQNELQRGKGYALAFGIDSLRLDPPEIVIVLDADCSVNLGSLSTLAHEARRLNRPCQSQNYVQMQKNPSSNQRLVAFAWLLKTYIRPFGMQAMGLPCHLMGTGMAIPWAIVSTQTLASNEIVEDLKLGIDCARGGYSPQFITSVRIESKAPESLEGQESQKKRWESGHLRFLFQYAPGLVWEGFMQRSASMIAMGIDLLIPPLAFYASALFLSSVICLLGLVFLGIVLPALITVLTICISAVTICLAWRVFGRNTISANQLVMVPIYIVRKIPLYASMLFGKSDGWVRTKRD
jgi:cellulose synthase/poly-beta-1,6-N-acetylglucosamine synthase-like glycosyltransferase